MEFHDALFDSSFMLSVGIAGIKYNSIKSLARKKMHWGGGGGGKVNRLEINFVSLNKNNSFAWLQAHQTLTSGCDARPSKANSHPLAVTSEGELPQMQSWILPEVVPLFCVFVDDRKLRLNNNIGSS